VQYIIKLKGNRQSRHFPIKNRNGASFSDKRREIFSTCSEYAKPDKATIKDVEINEMFSDVR